MTRWRIACALSLVGAACAHAAGPSPEDARQAMIQSLPITIGQYEVMARDCTAPDRLTCAAVVSEPGSFVCHFYRNAVDKTERSATFKRVDGQWTKLAGDTAQCRLSVVEP